MMSAGRVMMHDTCQNCLYHVGIGIYTIKDHREGQEDNRYTVNSLQAESSLSQ